MKVTMLLADAATVAEGKLYILGGGWSVTGPGPSPFALALKLEVPWNQAGRLHTVVLELLDEDGHPVSLGAPDEPLRIEGELSIDGYHDADWELGFLTRQAPLAA